MKKLLEQMERLTQERDAAARRLAEIQSDDERLSHDGSCKGGMAWSGILKPGLNHAVADPVVEFGG